MGEGHSPEWKEVVPTFGYVGLARLVALDESCIAKARGRQSSA